MINRIIKILIIVAAAMAASDNVCGQYVEYALDDSNGKTYTLGPASDNSSSKKNVVSEYIIQKEELTSIGLTAGDIHSISFKVADNSTVNNRSITVYMKHTTTTECTNTFASISSSAGLKRVVTDYKTVNWSPINSWCEVQFDTVFHYTGAQNLLVVIVDNTNATFPGQIEFYRRPTSEKRSLSATYSSQATLYADHISFSGATSLYSTMPIMKFKASNVPACPAPQNVTASTIYNDKVTIAWEEVGTATSWEVLYGPKGFYRDSDPDAGTRVITSDNPCTITGLQAGHEYDVYVRTAGSCVSAYTPVSFWTFTDCEEGGTERRAIGEQYLSDYAYYLPFYYYNKYSYTQTIYTAEDIQAGSGYITGIDYYQTTNMDVDFGTGNKSMKVYIKYTDSREFGSDRRFILINESTDKVFTSPSGFKFKYGWNHIEFDTPFSYDGVSNIVVAIKDDKNATYSNPIRFLYKYTGTGDGNYRSLYKGDANEIPVSTSTGSGRKNEYPDVIFHICNPGPFCSQPTITSVETNYGNATVTWDNGCTGIPDHYNVKYRIIDHQTEWTETTSTDASITLTGLDCGSKYEVQVQTVCTNSRLSIWSDSVTFVACGPHSIPFYEDFESCLHPETTSYTQTCVTMPCWHFIKYDGTDLINVEGDICGGSFGSISYNYTEGSGYVVAGHQSIYLNLFNFPTPKYKMLVLPEISAANLADCNVSFKIKPKATVSSGALTFYVGTMTDPLNVNTFRSYATVTHAYQSGETYQETASLQSYQQGTGNFVAIKIVCDGYSGEFGIDNIGVNFRATPSPPGSFEGHLYDCDEGVILTWTAPAGLSSPTYTLYRNGSQLAQTTNTRYVDSDVTSGDYTYTITATYGSPSSVTGYATYTVYGVNCCTRIPVTNFRVTDYGDRFVEVGWTATGASSCKLYYGINNPRTDLDGVWDVTPDRNPYKVLRLTNGQPYNFAIKPIGGTGGTCTDNPLSPTVTATPNCE